MPKLVSLRHGVVTAGNFSWSSCLPTDKLAELAAGISGPTQHLIDMRTSAPSLAIGMDTDMRIFDAADRALRGSCPLEPILESTARECGMSLVRVQGSRAAARGGIGEY